MQVAIRDFSTPSSPLIIVFRSPTTSRHPRIINTLLHTGISQATSPSSISSASTNHGTSKVLEAEVPTTKHPRDGGASTKNILAGKLERTSTSTINKPPCMVNNGLELNHLNNLMCNNLMCLPLHPHKLICLPLLHTYNRRCVTSLGQGVQLLMPRENRSRSDLQIQPSFILPNPPQQI